jgi:uncharacterized protein
MNASHEMTLMTPGTKGRLLLLVLAILAVAGCASAEPHWYRLTPVAGPTRSMVPARIDLRDVTLPRYLDRIDIIRAIDTDRLEIGNGDRWAGPLDRLITDALAQDLRLRLPDGVVADERLILSGPSGFVLNVELERFEPASDGSVVTAGQYILRSGQGEVLRTARFVERASAAGIDAKEQVRAYGETLGRLADRIAGDIVSAAR